MCSWSAAWHMEPQCFNWGKKNGEVGEGEERYCSLTDGRKDDG